MAELMLASVALNQVLNIIIPHCREEVGLLWNFKTDLEDMKKTLATLEAVMEDAERRSINDKALRLWLSEIKGACYDIEDILSDFLVESTKWDPQVEDDMVAKVRRITFRTGNSFIFRETLTSRMETMRKTLQTIAERRNRFHLREENVLDLKDVISNRETFSANEDFLGRDEEQTKIVKLILKKKTEKLIIIPIVGLAGLGKTALANLIFNDRRLRDSKHFEIWSWVYVSMKFNLLNVAKRLVASITGKKANYTDVELVSKKLKDLLYRKRYFIVFDDVWTENMTDMVNLYRMLNCGSKGSAIILTTRSKKIAEMVATPYNLPPLSDETCWLLFQRRAFQSTKLNEDPDLVEIGKEIVKKCKGVPSTINALGTMLSNRREKEFWSSVGKKDIWELHESNMFPSFSPVMVHNSMSEDRLLSSLRLSYYSMPSHLKSCFSYCSIFEKDCMIRKKELIHQWISLGLIHITMDLTPKYIAEEYLNQLSSLSFVSVSSVNTSDDDRPFTDFENECIMMHSLVHDLARLTARCDRYISVSNDKWTPEPEKYLVTKPRALHLCSADHTRKLCNKKWFSQLLYLRVLELENCDSEQLLKSVNKLKHLRYLSTKSLNVFPDIAALPYLRYLDLSFSKFKTIPDFIGHLYNLCYLKLEGNSIKEIPTTIGNLTNLEHLLISSELLASVPESIGNLRNLCYFKLHTKSINILPQTIGQLRKLQILDLSYSSSILTLPNSITNLENLEHLNLSACSNLKTLPEDLGKLQILKMLDLSCCSSILTLPQDIVSLQKLVLLNLSACRKLKKLPENFGNLSSLQSLNMRRCFGLELLPCSLKKLVHLEKLNLSGCSNVSFLPIEWKNMKKLSHLYTDGCSSLSSLSITLGITKLHNLQTFTLPDFTVSAAVAENVGMKCCSLVHLQHLNMLAGNLRITGLEKVVDSKNAKKAKLKQKHKLTSLELVWYSDTEHPNLRKNAITVLACLVPSSNLHNLEIQGYPGNKWPRWMVSTISKIDHLSSVRLVNIKYCNQVPPLGQLPNLKHVYLEMPEVTSIDRRFYGNNIQKAFPSLDVLELSNMTMLEEWLPDDDENIRAPLFPCISNLRLCVCPNLSELPEWLGDVSTLGLITIHDCIKLNSLPNRLARLPKLRHLEVVGCSRAFAEQYGSREKQEWSEFQISTYNFKQRYCIFSLDSIIFSNASYPVEDELFIDNANVCYKLLSKILTIMHI